MIQKDLLTRTYPGRDETLKVLNFIKDAANGKLDQVKYSRLDSPPQRGRKSTVHGENDKYLFRFQFETEDHYEERIRMANSFAYTKIIADSYKFLFESVDKRLTIKGASDDQVKNIIDNVDGMGTGIHRFAADMFYNILLEGESIVAADKRDYPYLYHIPRTSIRNFANDDNGEAFIIYETMKQKVTGIDAVNTSCIYVITRDEMAEFELEEGSSPIASNNADYVQTKNVDNPFGVIPVVHAQFSDKVPLLKPMASIDLNMTNIDSEMRSIIRNQAGLSFLVLPDGTDLSALSDQSIIFMPRGNDVQEPSWKAYPAHGLNAHFEYLRFMQATLFEASRLRRQKNEAESGISKALDFTQTKAVLNAGAEEVEKAVEKSLKFYFGYMGQDVEVEYSIERNFEVSQLDEELKILAQVLSLGLGSIAETAAKRQFRDKYITMSDQDKMMSDQELLDRDSEAFEINSGDNEGDNE